MMNTMNNEQLQTQVLESIHPQSEHERRMRGALTELALLNENALFANSGGISQHNRSLGFCPGYLNQATGEIAPSRYADGRLAPIHVLAGLPESWVESRDASGHVLAIDAAVVSGFIRNGCFYTREQAARAAAH
jgi:hypothetical protein